MEIIRANRHLSTLRNFSGAQIEKLVLRLGREGTFRGRVVLRAVRRPPGLKVLGGAVKFGESLCSRTCESLRAALPREGTQDFNTLYLLPSLLPPYPGFRLLSFVIGMA